MCRPCLRRRPRWDGAVGTFNEQRTVVPALRACAVGYVYEDIDPDAPAGAIRSVHAGHVLLQSEAAEALLPRDGADDPGPAPQGRGGSLTDREREVLALIADGRANRRDRPRPGAVGEDREDPMCPTSS